MNTNVSQKFLCVFICFLSPNIYSYLLKVGDLPARGFTLLPCYWSSFLWYNEAHGIWGRTTSFHFHFNAISNICFWIEVGSQMPIYVKRIKHLEEVPPIYSRCLLLWGWVADRAFKIMSMPILSVLFNRELWKKWQLTYSDRKSSWLNDSLNSRINRMCWNELVQNLVSLVFLLIISTLRSRLVGA